MAKKSSINKNEKRKALVKQYAPKFAALRAIANDQNADDSDRLMARLKMSALPRNANPTRVRNRCEITGRSRAYYRDFELCRICLRMFALRGELPGVIKASW